MFRVRLAILASATLLPVSLFGGEVKPSTIENQLHNIRSVSAEKKPAILLQLARDIASLPAGKQKLELADGLSHLVTEGDPGKEVLQATVDTLSQALKESPIAPKNDKVPAPYYDLAKLVRYENLTTGLDDPQFAKATRMLEENDASLNNVDFTLKDLKGNKVTFSQLRGKLVLVNFWATWCGPCRLEMPDLDIISEYFKSQGLVVLSITDEDLFKVGQFLSASRYRPTVLFDPGGTVHRQFHVTGIPNTYLFGRDGKLLAVGIDQRTRRQFLEMLQKTDLHEP